MDYVTHLVKREIEAITGQNVYLDRVSDEVKLSDNGQVIVLEGWEEGDNRSGSRLLSKKVGILVTIYSNGKNAIGDINTIEARLVQYGFKVEEKGQSYVKQINRHTTQIKMVNSHYNGVDYLA